MDSKIILDVDEIEINLIYYIILNLQSILIYTVLLNNRLISFLDHTEFIQGVQVF